MSRAFCSEGQHYPDELIAEVIDGPGRRADETTGYEIGVLLDNSGEPTGHYSDGVFGLTDEVYWLAREG